jgi:hypothetical protein
MEHHDPIEPRLAEIIELLGNRSRARSAAVVTREDPPPTLPGVYSCVG